MDMIEIKGKVNTAICYARVVEDEAIEQIRRMCDYPMTEGAKIRIMPDVHSGKGCTFYSIRNECLGRTAGAFLLRLQKRKGKKKCLRLSV